VTREGVVQTLRHTVEFSTHAHKRVPSVYAGTEIKPNDIGYRQAVTYSGPTYIAIRSGSTPHPQLFTDTDNKLTFTVLARSGGVSVGVELV